MRSGATGIVLFLSSYAPLFIVFGLLDSFGSGVASYVCYGLAAFSLVALYVSFRSWRRLSPSEITVSRARPRDADVIAYVATYIVPFAALGVDTWKQRAALIAFLVLVGVLYARANLFYVNPILALARFNLYEVETESGRVMLVITKAKYLQVGASLQVRTLSDYVFLEAT